MSAVVRGMRGGQPSTTQPIAAPWLSPNVVTRKRWPKVLNDMQSRLRNEPRWRLYEPNRQSCKAMPDPHEGAVPVRRKRHRHAFAVAGTLLPIRRRCLHLLNRDLAS